MGVETSCLLTVGCASKKKGLCSASQALYFSNTSTFVLKNPVNTAVTVLIRYSKSIVRTRTHRSKIIPFWRER